MKNLIILFFASFLLFGCGPSLSYFTQDLYDQNRWSENDLKKIQFYLSRDIVLKRQLRDGTSEIVNGKIKMEDGRKIEEIVIRRGTPGILMFSPKDNRLAVSFEDGSRKRFLMFGPSADLGGRYVLLASDWKRRRGTVRYDGRKYYVDADAAYAALMVNLDRINRVQVNARTAPGRSVD